MMLAIRRWLLFASFGSAFGSAWAFADAAALEPRSPRGEVVRAAADSIDWGRMQVPRCRRDRDAAQDREWWGNLLWGNFTGSVVDVPAASVCPAAADPTRQSVEEVLDIVCIVHDSGGGGRCVVRYKDAAQAAPPRDTQPDGGCASGIVQHLEVGDALWSPYGHIRLVRVQSDAEAVYFERKVSVAHGRGNGGGAGWPREPLQPVEDKLRKTELVLAADLAAAVVGLPQPSAARPGAGEITWIDVPSTRAVRPCEVHVSRSHARALEEGGPELLQEGVTMVAYAASSDAVRGIQLTAVSPQIEPLGLRSGDVLLRLNGVPLTTRAQAYAHGKRLWRRGVRTFRVRVRTSDGEIQERSVVWPAR